VNGKGSIQRRDRGCRADLAGRSAEDIVCRHYLDRGARVLGRRWRGAGGEIDLVFDLAGTTLFVEVKKAADFAAAAARVGPAQIVRLSQAAEEYLGAHAGTVSSECRFDVAFVDRVGRVEVLENAFA
jgi:putative endonuclease